MSDQVPLALRGLTSVFGMGTGGSLSLSSPKIVEYVLRTFTTAYPFSFQALTKLSLIVRIEY